MIDKVALWVCERLRVTEGVTDAVRSCDPDCVSDGVLTALDDWVKVALLVGEGVDDDD